MPNIRHITTTPGSQGARSRPAASFAVQLGAGRTVIAAAMLAAPVPAARLLGVDTATARRVTWLTRMVGVRDGVIGLGALDSVRRNTGAASWLLGGAVADAVDAMVIGTALKHGRLRGIVPATVVFGAGGSAMLHAITAIRLRRT